MIRSIRSLLALAALAISGSAVLAISGCATLDISHDSAVDFGRYRTVAVSVTSAYGDSSDDTSYLIRELNDVSAFENAVAADQQADLRLGVTVSVHAIEDSEGFLDYVADAHYVVTTPEGETLLDDAVSDTSSLPSEAIEDALDEVARVFTPPYDY